MNNLRKKFGKLKINCARITISENELVPEVEVITKIKFAKSIEQKNDPMILDVYQYSSIWGFTTGVTVTGSPCQKSHGNGTGNT